MKKQVDFSKLEDKTLVYLAVSLLVLSFVFSSLTLTGFAMLDSTPSDTNLAGMIFFVLSILVCFFIYLKNKD